MDSVRPRSSIDIGRQDERPSEDPPARSVARSGLYTGGSDDAFEQSTRLAREWIVMQAEDWQMPSPDFSRPLATSTSGSARLITQTDAATFAFALSHADQRARNVEWKILGSITATEGRCLVDVAVEVIGVWRGVVPPLGMPGFIARIIEQVGMMDIWPLSLDARRITVESAPDFVDFLRNTERQLPVIALSEPSSISPDEIQRLCARVAGVAHVVVVQTPASFAISDRMGRDFSVYRGAVRVYHPRLSNSPFDVPLFFAPAIERINNSGRRNGPFGLLRFVDMLVRAALDRTIWPPPGGVREATLSAPPPARPLTLQTQGMLSATPQAELASTSAVATQQAGEALDAFDAAEGRAADPSVSDQRAEIERIRADLEAERAEKERYFDEYVRLELELEQRKHGEVPGIDSEIAGASEHDLTALRALADAHAAMKSIIERGVAAQSETQDLRDRVAALERDLRQQQYVIDGLRQRGVALNERAGAVARPKTYRNVAELERYLAATHGNHLILHPNAKRTFEDGAYDDEEHLIELLDLLGEHYYKMKIGVPGAYAVFAAERERLMVKYSKVLSATSVGEYGRYYEVSWDGKTISPMDIWHVRNNGTTYDPRRMGALYFFWDDERRTTVITSGPEKLPTPSDRT